MINRIALFKKNYQQVLFIFLAFLGMVLVSYFYVSDIVTKQMLLICDGILDTTETAVSATLMDRELSFANISLSFEKLIRSGETNEEMLQFLKETNAFHLDKRTSMPDFMKIYAYIRGEFLDGSAWIPPPDYDAKMRPWYIGAINNHRDIFLSEPYVDAQTGNQVISISQLISDSSGEMYGVLAIDLNLSEITDYIRNQKIANNGYGVFITDKLVFTVHSNPELVGKSLNSVGGDYRNFTYMLVNRYPVIAERFTDYNGVDSIAFFRTLFNGWHIGVITPRMKYYQSVYNLAFVLGIMGFLLMVSLSYLLVNSNVKQIKADDENKSKSSFLARMSHEMRTPMNAIIGMTHIARNSNDPARIQDCLGKINDASIHLLGVINDVLDMSKIEAGKLELINADFNLKEMINKVSDVVSFKIDEKNQSFNINIADNVPSYINSDKQLLSQVITNLLTNASKFTPENGKIGMTVSVQDFHQENIILQFAVQDTGIGIAKELQAKLFEPFEQADGSISRKFGGTGLGLVISRRIVEMMHGRISLESEEGKGTRFIFTIEAGIAEDPHNEPSLETSNDQSDTHDGAANQDNAPNDSAPQDNSSDCFDFSGKHILLTEDVAVNREIIVTLLEDTHIKIDCAENGFEACEKFENNPHQYDLIFMDIHMPEMDGFEAAKKIRAMNSEEAKTIPIIAMTADVFREDVERMLHSGMNDHIGKPVEISEILQKLRKYLFSV
jgi:signal transduction histidine kinase/CheY-like chemotaxis protein